MRNTPCNCTACGWRVCRCCCTCSGFATIAQYLDHKVSSTGAEAKVSMAGVLLWGLMAAAMVAPLGGTSAYTDSITILTDAGLEMGNLVYLWVAILGYYTVKVCGLKTRHCVPPRPHCTTLLGPNKLWSTGSQQRTQQPSVNGLHTQGRAASMQKCSREGGQSRSPSWHMMCCIEIMFDYEALRTVRLCAVLCLCAGVYNGPGDECEGVAAA
jgi:hypothetical protein